MIASPTMPRLADLSDDAFAAVKNPASLSPSFDEPRPTHEVIAEVDADDRLRGWCWPERWDGLS